MGWDNVTGDAKIVPSAGGNSNEIKLENGKARRVRILDNEPYSYLEHTLEIDGLENGQPTKTFRTIRCPKTSDNPNAHCPLCDGQVLKRRIRHAINVWDYETNSVQKLNAGENVFKPIATTRKLGVDILSVDWAILKTGEGRNDTTYSATNLGPSPFTLSEGTSLYDLKSDYAPHSVDDMKQIIESCGGNWDTCITQPTLMYPSLQDALAHVMPNGKYKDKTFQQIWDLDKSPKGMINYLATKSDRITMEKACAQVILVNLGGANIPGVPLDGQTSTAASTATVSTAPTATAPTADRTNKINNINQLLATKPKYVNGGFNLIMEVMKSVGNGKTNISDFTDAELDAMLTECNKD